MDHGLIILNRKINQGKERGGKKGTKEGGIKLPMWLTSEWCLLSKPNRSAAQAAPRHLWVNASGPFTDPSYPSIRFCSSASPSSWWWLQDLLLSLLRLRYGMNDMTARCNSSAGRKRWSLGLRVRTGKKASKEIPEEGSLAPRKRNTM